VPTWNQDTTGNAATATSVTGPVAGSQVVGDIAGNATGFTGSLDGDVTGGQSTTTVVRINGTSLGGLATGILKNTTGTGVPSIATAADLAAPGYAAGGGNAQEQTVTLSPAVPALTNGLVVSWLPAVANNAAAPTLAVNGLTATTITKCGTTALAAGDLTNTAVAYAVYDGVNFELQNPQAVGCGNTGGSATSFTGSLSGDVTGTQNATAVVNGSNITNASIPNAGLANSSVTVTAGTGLSGGGTVPLGGSTTLTNAGVTSIAGTTNQITASGSTGAVTLSLPATISVNISGNAASAASLATRVDRRPRQR